MATEELPREQWQEVLDAFARRWLRDEAPEWVELELVSPQLGDQPLTGWQRLQGVSYDPRDDVFTVEAGDHVEHMVHHPAAISVVREDDGWISEITVREQDQETVHLIHLRRRAPEAHGALPD